MPCSMRCRCLCRARSSNSRPHRNWPGGFQPFRRLSFRPSLSTRSSYEFALESMKSRSANTKPRCMWPLLSISMSHRHLMFFLHALTAPRRCTPKLCHNHFPASSKGCKRSQWCDTTCERTPCGPCTRTLPTFGHAAGIAGTKTVTLLHAFSWLSMMRQSQSEKYCIDLQGPPITRIRKSRLNRPQGKTFRL